jgi:hypothetical protein
MAFTGGAFSAIPLAFYQIPGETLGYYHSIYFGCVQQSKIKDRVVVVEANS